MAVHNVVMRPMDVHTAGQCADALVETVALTRRFGARAAVNNLSFAVGRGEIFGIVGPDGSGKTTALRLLAAILDPTSGSARVAGHDTVREAEQVKARIGYMSQRFGLYSDLTVAENLDFYADLYNVPRAGRAPAVERLLRFSGLVPFTGRFAGDLSGGMKQKLGLACTLIHTPEVLLLDEPTNGVDPVSRRDFWRMICQLVRERVTIVVTTSYLDEAERCTRVGLMHEGGLLACGTPGEVKGLLHGAVLELRCAGPRAAAAALRPRLERSSINVFGDGIHIVTDEPAGVEEKVRGILDAAGIRTERVRRIEPGLEDVFVALLAPESGARHGE